ncbi:MAG: hypothetical protein FWD28_09775 [Treponema sp.]|nr:hypothetical protein [Treponema sp.]
MKKLIVFLVIVAFFAVISGCDLALPNAVQIVGNPELRFSANLDMGELLDSMVEGLFSSHPGVIRCTNTPVRTFIIRQDLYNQTILIFPSEIIDGLSASGGVYTVGAFGEGPIELIPAGSPITLEGIDFGSFLDDFKFLDAKARLYISGSSIVDILTIELNIDGDLSTNSGRSQSGLSGTQYPGLDLPAGINLPFIFDGTAASISFRAYIEEGKIITNSMLSGANVRLEIAVWLPMNLEITGVSGASFEFPPDFFPSGDLFGRQSAADSNPLAEFIEALSIDIKMNSSPFTGADLVVKSGAIEIVNSLSGNSLHFQISEAHMAAINSTFPFTPVLSVKFVQGGRITLPRVFRATEFAFRAKVNYRIEF